MSPIKKHPLISRMKSSLNKKFSPTSGKDIEKANILVVYLISIGRVEEAESLLHSYINKDISSFKLYDYSEYLDALSISAFLSECYKKSNDDALAIIKKYYDKDSEELDDHSQEMPRSYFTAMSSSASGLLSIRDWGVKDKAEYLAEYALTFMHYWAMAKIYEDRFPMGEAVDLRVRVEGHLAWLDELLR